MAQAGKIKIVAVTNNQRAPALPDVPTAREAGFPDLAYEAFLGFFAPRGMSLEVRERSPWSESLQYLGFLGALWMTETISVSRAGGGSATDI